MSSGRVWCGISLYRVCKWWHEGSHMISVSSIDLRTQSSVQQQTTAFCRNVIVWTVLENEWSHNRLSQSFLLDGSETKSKWRVSSICQDTNAFRSQCISHTLTVRQLVSQLYLLFYFYKKHHLRVTFPLLIGTCVCAQFLVQVWYLNKPFVSSAFSPELPPSLRSIIIVIELLGASAQTPPHSKPR